MHPRVLDAIVELLPDGLGEGGGERLEAFVHDPGDDGAPGDDLRALLPRPAGAIVVVVGAGLGEGDVEDARGRGEEDEQVRRRHPCHDGRSSYYAASGGSGKGGMDGGGGGRPHVALMARRNRRERNATNGWLVGKGCIWSTNVA
jgi:hypothetical protein